VVPQLAAAITAARPNIGAFTLSSPGDAVLFHSPAHTWQRCPVLARRPAQVFVSFHRHRFKKDACQSSEMLSDIWALWVNEADPKIRPAEPEPVDSASAAKGRYDVHGGDAGQRRYVAPQTVPERESLALLTLRTALRPVEDAIGLSAALWKDQVGSWGQAPGPTLACPATAVPDGADEPAPKSPGAKGQGWEAVGCADDGSGRVLKVKLLGLTDGTGSDAGNGGGGRFEGTLPAALGGLASLQELWLNIHSISGTVRVHTTPPRC
jgi:hypothetical protein